MRVSVTFAIGNKETVLEGNCSLFNGRRDYTKGYDMSLHDIGFWLNNWKYAEHDGPDHKSKVFIPWTSALYVVELDN